MFISSTSQNGNLTESLDRLKEFRQADDDKKDLFRYDLYQALLCMEAGGTNIALSILVKLDKQIEEHKLNTWNPVLTLKVWPHLYQCYKALETETGNVEYASEAQKVFDRISEIDPGFAFTLLNS